MSSKNDYSKKILKVLGQKQAISLPELTDKVNTHSDQKNPKYAITRSLKGLRDAGLIEQVASPQNQYARLTKEGKKKVHSLALDSDTAMVNTSWDGLWRIILLDLPESRKPSEASVTCSKSRLCVPPKILHGSPHSPSSTFSPTSKKISASPQR
jgi:hypothetical protein